MSEITKKITVVVLTLALALTAVPGAVAGQTVAELQVRVNELQALVAELRGRLDASAATPAVGALAACERITFNRNLSLGASGSDVKCLQALLNTDPDTRVAATGAGSPGREIERFGRLTRAAVIAFQTKHADEVLEPVGLTRGTGFVGVHTRAKLNAMLAAAPTTPTTPTTPATPTPPAVDPAATEGDLTSKLLPTPTGVEVAWNASNVSVMGVEVEARGSAITIQRLDVNFNNDRPWRFINHIALFDGGNAVQGIAVTSANVTVLSATESRIRFSGLNISVPRNTKKALTLRVGTDARPVVGGGTLAARTLELSIPGNGIRGVDGLGINQTTPASPIRREFTIREALQGGGIEIRLNTASPREGIAISDVDNPTEHEILRTDLVVTRDNVQVRGLTFNVTGSTAATLNAVRAVRLFDGATSIGSVELADHATTTTRTAVFGDLSIDINSGATRTLSLRVDVPANATGRIHADLPNANVTARSANDAEAVPSGSAMGRRIHFFTVAPVISNISATLTAGPAATASSGAHIVAGETPHADGRIAFRLTAQGGNVVINDANGVVAAAAPTGAAIPAGARITIGGKVLGSGLDPADRTILNGQSADIVIEGRISATADSLRSWLAVTEINWGTNTMPGELLRDLVTNTVIIN